MKDSVLYTFAVILFLQLSCSPIPNKKNDDCAITINELLQNDGKRLQVNDRENGVINQLVDKTSGIDDSVTVGAYYFYPNGILKSYKFFASSNKYQYNQEYDSLGKIILIEGSPLVLHMFRGIDSSIVRFTFLFSTLHNEYRNINIKTNTGIQFNANLVKDPVFTNMNSVTFDLPVVKSLKRLEIITSGELYNTCLNKQWNLKDTLFPIIDE